MVDSPFKKLEDVAADKSLPEVKSSLAEFMSRMYNPEDECEVKDCDEVTCPECKGALKTVFGTIPLEVCCSQCDQVFILRLLLSLPT